MANNAKRISELTEVQSPASGQFVAVDDGGQDGAKKLDVTKIATTVDSAMSSTSTNPVQNNVVKAALDTKVDKETGKYLVTVDSALSTTSTNPVQNKVVAGKLGDTDISSIGDGSATGAIIALYDGLLPVMKPMLIAPKAMFTHMREMITVGYHMGVFIVGEDGKTGSPDGNGGWSIMYHHSTGTSRIFVTAYSVSNPDIRYSKIDSTDGSVELPWTKIPTRSEVDKLNTDLNTLTTLTLTRTENPYCDVSSFARLGAFKRGGVLFFNGNLYLDFSQSTPSDFVEIGRISGWNAPTSISLTVPQQSNGSKIALVEVGYSGIIKIYTVTGAASGFFRFSICVPYT